MASRRRHYTLDSVTFGLSQHPEFLFRVYGTRNRRESSISRAKNFSLWYVENNRTQLVAKYEPFPPGLLVNEKVRFIEQVVDFLYQIPKKKKRKKPAPKIRIDLSREYKEIMSRSQGPAKIEKFYGTLDKNIEITHRNIQSVLKKVEPAFRREILRIWKQRTKGEDLSLFRLTFKSNLGFKSLFLKDAFIEEGIGTERVALANSKEFLEESIDDLFEWVKTKLHYYLVQAREASIELTGFTYENMYEKEGLPILHNPRKVKKATSGYVEVKNVKFWYCVSCNVDVPKGSRCRYCGKSRKELK